ncbi:diguanylate cyclase [Alkanindiges illinoisensis]|uniref:diguanylate cyclase n=1 Tax=Alkanindiges illinoisensis TaxID=197183 RepID=A0A4Y7XGJ8_9GAMM|nr:diguanylate cyclase [Alkanindiges illinoisensis]TEU30686.1 GGDEF domain-containing protein [Alkanindiges illinoisensis]
MKLQGSNLLERKEIQKLLGKDLNFVWFPAKLEKDYRFQYQNEAAHEFRYRGPIILLLYLFLSYGIYQLLPAEQVGLWLKLYGCVGIIILTAWGFSWFEKMHQWFDWYATIGSTIAIAISFTIVNLVHDEQGSVLLHAAIMYAVVIVYGFVGLRFYVAILAGWVGGALGTLVSMYFSNEIAWTLLNRTYTFSSFLGMALAYVTDRHHRENYLQSCLLELHRIEMVQQTQQLEVMSRQDALTGIANRRYLDEMLEEEWYRAMRHQTPLSMMMIDIDYFKAYNDSLGHLAGDQCLLKIAHAITKVATRSGELVARYGGEEFVILLPMTSQQHAIRQAERLLRAIKNLHIPHPASEISQHVTLSIGVVTYVPQMNEDVNDFLYCADHALYKAKNRGRDGYVFAHLAPQSLSNTKAS